MKSLGEKHPKTMFYDAFIRVYRKAKKFNQDTGALETTLKTIVEDMNRITIEKDLSLMTNQELRKTLRRYNFYILFKRDEDPSMNMFPDSILEWDSTQDLNYLKFLTNKSMNITDKGVEKMLNELQKDYNERNKPVQPTGPRKRGRPKK